MQEIMTQRIAVVTPVHESLVRVRIESARIDNIISLVTSHLWSLDAVDIFSCHAWPVTSRRLFSSRIASHESTIVTRRQSRDVIHRMQYTFQLVENHQLYSIVCVAGNVYACTHDVCCYNSVNTAHSRSWTNSMGTMLSSHMVDL